MAKQSVETPDIETMGEVAASKTEVFFENNGKKVVTAIAALIVVVAAIFGYKALVLEPAELRAGEAVYAAQSIFDGVNPDYQAALDGSESAPGFLEVIEMYGSTATGNLACHYAGICYLRLGDNQNAKRYLQQYKAQKGIPAQIINAQNIALQGDIAVNESNYSEAVKLFEKAAALSENPLTTPLFTRKAGQAAQAAGDKALATSLYERVMTQYPATNEARTAEKLLGSIK